VVNRKAHGVSKTRSISVMRWTGGDTGPSYSRNTVVAAVFSAAEYGAGGIRTRCGAGRSRDRIPVGEIFRTRPYQSWDPPSLLYNGYRISFPGLKRPGRGVHSFSSSVEVKEIVEACHHSPSGPQWPVVERALPILPFCILFCYTYTLYIILCIHNRKKLLCQNHKTNTLITQFAL